MLGAPEPVGLGFPAEGLPKTPPVPPPLDPGWPNVEPLLPLVPEPDMPEPCEPVMPEPLVVALGVP